ncbi:unnamed protein product [Caenorhabditis auriculariae]|uniref:C2H2-type domain-containing protein n=1 Tax=Caenorhabditis auriculariae TaxID=2777116 RepID=A0A8S1GU10_9PELO|nr:unnamed protein product [Caenorhabditis auriculariae]
MESLGRRRHHNQPGSLETHLLVSDPRRTSRDSHFCLFPSSFVPFSDKELVKIMSVVSRKKSGRSSRENESRSPSLPPAKKILIEIKQEECNEVYDIKCQLCDVVCNSIAQLQTHTLNSHAPSIEDKTKKSHISCQQCDSSFDSFMQFAVHMRSHLSSTSSSPKLTCPFCTNLTFSDVQSRLEHVASHFEVRVPHRVCSECHLPFSTISALASHFTQTHLRLKYQCTGCPFSSDSEKGFRDHCKDHSSEEMMFTCRVCGIPFANSQLVAIHVQLIHDREIFHYEKDIKDTRERRLPLKSPELRLIQCSVCDEALLGEDSLDEHRLLMHCKVPHGDKCAECQEPINTQEDFVEHCRRHAEDLAMRCPVCRQSLRSETQVHAHKNFHMVGGPPITANCLVKREVEEEQDEVERPADERRQIRRSLKCVRCDIAFNDVAKFDSHMKLHGTTSSPRQSANPVACDDL